MSRDFKTRHAVSFARGELGFDKVVMRGEKGFLTVAFPLMTHTTKTG
jgi:hypothetical protein